MARLPSLRDLDTRLRRAREAEERQRSWRRRPQGRHGVLGMAFEAATELVGSLVVAVGIGWMLDRWLETRPLFLVVFFFLGAAAGGMNVYRRARALSRDVTKEGPDEGPGEEGPDDSGEGGDDRPARD